MRMTTVAINPIPKANATSLRRFFCIMMLLKYPVAEDISSDVIRRMIAITANHRLMSDRDRGKFIS